MRHIFLIIALAFCSLASQAQQQTKSVTLYEAIMIAQEQSIDGLMAK